MNTILVPVDFSAPADAVLAEAMRLAQALKAGVVLSHVFPPATLWDQPAFADSPRNQEIESALRLDEYRQRFAERQASCETRQFVGTPGREIVAEAFRIRPDYIVIGSHGHTALHDLLLGSTVAHVLRHSPVPVLLVPVGDRPEAAPHPDRVMEALTD